MSKDNFVRKSVTVTPSDTDNLTSTGRGLLVDVAGTVKVTWSDGTTDNPTLIAGVWHPMAKFKRVWATGTSATGIHVGW